MSIKWHCPSCGKYLRADDTLAGRRTRCKVCKADQMIPTSRPAPRRPQDSQNAAALPAKLHSWLLTPWTISAVSVVGAIALSIGVLANAGVRSNAEAKARQDQALHAAQEVERKESERLHAEAERARRERAAAMIAESAFKKIQESEKNEGADLERIRDAYRQFLESHPGCPQELKKNALAKIDNDLPARIEETAFHLAKGEASPLSSKSSLQSFLVKFPKGKNAQGARDLLAQIAAKEQAELDAAKPWSGEKIYQHVSLATVYITGKVKKAGPPSTLDNSVWQGKETLKGFGDFQFQFPTAGEVDLLDKQGLHPGTFEVSGNKVNLIFLRPQIKYTGTLSNDGNEMSGTAECPVNENDKQTVQKWRWTAKRLTNSTCLRFSEGSGALIDRKEKLVVTNLHVVDSCVELQAFFPDLNGEGKPIVNSDHYRGRSGIPFKVVARNEKADLCLVRLQTVPAWARCLVMGDKVDPGQSVHSVGNPGASRAFWIYAPGKVRASFRDRWLSGTARSQYNLDAQKIETDSPLNPGDSGGPLVDDHGRLVGVAQSVSTKDKGFSYFIASSEVQALLSSYKTGESVTADPQNQQPSGPSIGAKR